MTIRLITARQSAIPSKLNLRVALAYYLHHGWQLYQPNDAEFSQIGYCGSMILAILATLFEVYDVEKFK